MDMNYRRFLPVTFQFSVILTLPWLIGIVGWQALWVLPLAWIYHWLSFALTGHMIISHGRQSWIPHEILYTLFFYTTYITPHFWGAQHIQHHKHLDTERDPQSPDYLGWRTLIAFYDERLTDKRTMVKHLRTNLSQFYVKYYVWLLIPPAILAIILPVELFLMFYAVPASMSFTIATFSAWYSHQNFKPVERFPAWANILFSGETRYHARHHDMWHYCEPNTEFLLRSPHSQGYNYPV